MAVSARRVIHSATVGGMPSGEVPFIHRLTTARSQSRCSAKAEAVQPRASMQSLSRTPFRVFIT